MPSGIGTLWAATGKTQIKPMNSNIGMNNFRVFRVIRLPVFDTSEVDITAATGDASDIGISTGSH
jgi:hypothetical protein